MKETKKTVIVAVVALISVLIAVISYPKTETPENLKDEGTLFFPDFIDPNSATSLEVIEYDSTTGKTTPFKVLNGAKGWTIPSNYDYPADGKDKLAKTAAEIIGLKRDIFRSQRVEDFEQYGVIDPLSPDETQLLGRGTLLTIKGHGDNTLAAIIIGKAVEGKRGYYYVRKKDEKRVYAAKFTPSHSTLFKDWIDLDLLQVDRNKIDRITIKDYRVDENSGSLQKKDEVFLSKITSDWTIDKASAGKVLDKSKVNTLLSSIDGLSIVGVRPKPEGVTAALKKMDGKELRIANDVFASLQSKGYFFGRDGSLYSNEGEVSFTTEDGIEYTLRFGEVATAENGEEKDKLNRYLFVSTRITEEFAKEPVNPTADAVMAVEGVDSSLVAEYEKLKKEWKEQYDKAQELQKDLELRFGKWYYLISSESFDKIQVKRASLLKDEEKEKR